MGCVCSNVQVFTKVLLKHGSNESVSVDIYLFTALLRFQVTDAVPTPVS